MTNALREQRLTDKQIEFKNFCIQYDNLNSAQQIISGITQFHPSKSIPNKVDTLIIDAGSNIGIGALYFKSLYPLAGLLCFEPDPHAFKILQANIINNKISNANLVNAALANYEGEIDFFGQIFVDSPDARGNSIIDSWGLQRNINNTTKVKSLKLSSYINSKVDFLKLNIEGAEQQVLEDLEKENKLIFIEEMAIEVHYAIATKDINNIDTIANILKRNNFKYEVIEKDKSDRLPLEIRGWVEKIQPQFFSIRAIKL